MELRVEESGPLERKLRVEIPTAEVDAAFDEVYERLRRKAHLKGFRPGKAPRAVLERYFADEARSDVLERLVQQTLPKAVDQAALDLVTMPRVAPPQEAPRQGTPFAYEAHVELRPVIELKQVRGLPLPEILLEEPEGDPVQAYLEEAQRERAILHPEDAAQQAAGGHVGVFEVSAARGGADWLKTAERSLVLGEEQLVAGFDAQVIGMCAGESREFELELPAEAVARAGHEHADHDHDHDGHDHDHHGHGHDHHNHEHGDHDHAHAHEPAAQAAEGQTPAEPLRASFRVKLAQLKRRELPALDDEFAKDISECETLEALRAELRQRYEQGREAERVQRREQAVLDALIEANGFPVPQSLVEQQVTRRLREAFRGLDLRRPDERMSQLIGEFSARLRPAAERDVRAAFLFREIAQAEKIEVGDDEVTAHVRELAERRGESPKQALRDARDGEYAGAVRQHLIERRVFALLLEHATPAHA